MSVFACKLFSILFGFAFPVFLLRAIREQKNPNGGSLFTILSSVSFGFIIFTIMGLLPNW